MASLIYQFTHIAGLRKRCCVSRLDRWIRGVMARRLLREIGAQRLAELGFPAEWLTGHSDRFRER